MKIEPGGHTVGNEEGCTGHRIPPPLALLLVGLQRAELLFGGGFRHIGTTDLPFAFTSVSVETDVPAPPPSESQSYRHHLHLTPARHW
jgi:hypothetical protein